MSNKDKLYKLADKIGEQVFDTICIQLLQPDEWYPVAIKGNADVPYMVVSKDVGGMVMVARWINPSAITKITSEDIADMIVGADGRSTN